MERLNLVLQHAYIGRRDEFVETVHWFRERKGMSRADLVRLIKGPGVKLTTAKRWVSIGPPFDQAYRFAEALNVPLTYLILRHNIAAGISSDAAEMLNLWQYLDEQVRGDLLRLARTLALRGDHPVP